MPIRPRRASRDEPERKRASSPARQSAAPSRPLWRGQIRVALVTVGVRLYAATRPGARIAFHQVHKPSGKRIRYEKVVPGIGPVDTVDIVRGIETARGQYVLLSDEDLDHVKLEAKRVVDIVQFVDHCAIDPMFYDSAYYAVPDGELAEDAFRVLRDALRASGKMGLGQFVMRGRECIAALRPHGQGLELETLHFADEIRGAAPLFDEIGEGRADPELVEMMTELIERKSSPFKPDSFKDEYTQALRALIQARVEKHKVVDVGGEEEPPGAAKIVDLVEALRRSVGNAGTARGRAASDQSKAASGRPGRGRRKSG